MKFLDRLQSGAPGADQAAIQAQTDPRAFEQLKVTLHNKVIDRLDLKLVQTLTRDQLREQLREVVESLVALENLQLNPSERDRIVVSILDEILGLGPLEPVLADPAVSDVLVNGPHQIYVEKGGKLQLTNIRFRDNQHLQNTINRIVARIGRRVDESSPMVDARLPDGSRVNAIIPPLALDGAALSIRRFGTKTLGPDDLIRFGSISPHMVNYLRAAVIAKFNILVSGGTGSGKTTLLNIISSFIPEDERIVTIEDSAELRLQQEHKVRLETRPPNLEGRGEVTIHDLVKNTLRMRPDRLIIGEVRSVEVIDMLQAMNTGHEGSMATVHANTSEDAISRLMTMMAMAGTKLSEESMSQIIGRAVHLVVQLNRMTDGGRRVMALSEIIGFEGRRVLLQDVFVFQHQGFDQEGRIIGQFVNQYPTSYGERFRTFGVNPGVPAR